MTAEHFDVLRGDTALRRNRRWWNDGVKHVVSTVEHAYLLQASAVERARWLEEQDWIEFDPELVRKK